jgi:cytochrome b subunit of formate dehydrogenase
LNNLKENIFGPDSLVPNFKDALHLWQRILWFFSLGPPPKLDRWAYWEKFDYWAVFWGMPLLAVTGLMLKYPVMTCSIMPGWILNVAALLHRAEAILACCFIFIVHFFIGHFRPSSFPMNEAMFSGRVMLKEAMEEKPAWVERIKKEEKTEISSAESTTFWFRALYFIFGFMALGFGLYLLINGIFYSRYVQLH